jgi:hypothetical protein
MFFRLRTRLFHLLSHLTCTAALAGAFLAGNAMAFEVSYAPEALFVGDPLTFRIESPSTTTLTVMSNQVEVVRHPLSPKIPLEVTFFPTTSQILRFEAPEKTAQAFRLLRPGEAGVFRERDGYLEIDEAPVILLPEHRKPPPLDRRWETLDLLRKTLTDTRKPILDVLWICPPDSTLSTALQPLLSSRPPLVPDPGEESWFRVHAPLLSPRIPQATYLVVEIDVYDLERGVAPQTLFLKWQFVLQHLEKRSGTTRGLLFGPDLASNPAPKPMLESLQSLARSHGLHYVDRSLPEAIWRERLIHQLQREYILP